MTALRLDNQWDFFAPVVALGTILRYDVEDRSGKAHAFVPSRDLSLVGPELPVVPLVVLPHHRGPGRLRRGRRCLLLPQACGPQPLAVTFYEIREEEYTVEDYQKGKQRMDQGYFSIHLLRGCGARIHDARARGPTHVREADRDLVSIWFQQKPTRAA